MQPRAGAGRFTYLHLSFLICKGGGLTAPTAFAVRIPGEDARAAVNMLWVPSKWQSQQILEQFGLGAGRERERGVWRRPYGKDRKKSKKQKWRQRKST